MASLVSCRIRQEQAVERMKAAMSAIGQEFGLEPAEFLMRGRDPELLRAQQFETIAEWLDVLTSAVQQPQRAGYDSLTVKELTALLLERGYELTQGSGVRGAVVRSDLIAALNADDKARIARNAQVGALG